jgi:hypothetical protein
MDRFSKTLGFVLLVLRFYIIYKMVALLYMSHQNPIEHPIEDITWWVYVLIFDIWLQFILPPYESLSDDPEN